MKKSAFIVAALIAAALLIASGFGIGISINSSANSSIKSTTVTVVYPSAVKTISLKEEDIGLEGFTATKEIILDGNNAVIKLTNISFDGRGSTIVHIAGGSAIYENFTMIDKIDIPVSLSA